MEQIGVEELIEALEELDEEAYSSHLTIEAPTKEDIEISTEEEDP